MNNCRGNDHNKQQHNNAFNKADFCLFLQEISLCACFLSSAILLL